MSLYYIPLFFLVLTIALYIWSVRVLRQYDWTPVHVPVSFEKAHSYTATFRADKTTTYYIETERDRRADESFDDDPVRSAVVSCVVRNAAGRTVGEPASGGGYGEKIYATLLKFPATQGETYTVTLAVRKSSADADRLNPHLKVEITPIDFKTAYVKAALIQYGALFSALTTVATFLYAAMKHRLLPPL